MQKNKTTGGKPMKHHIPEGWFLHESLIDFADNSILSVADRIDKPAGRHGWLKAEGENLVFEDGTPFKFWGSNVTEGQVCKPGRPTLNAKRMTKLGINGMRFHKFTWAGKGIISDPPTKVTDLDPARMKEMDQFFHELKQEGIYVTWSHIFGQQASPLDALESGFVGMGLFYDDDNGYAVINAIHELQELAFTLTKNMLNHKNEFTGLRYADDPALAIIELQNEDNVWWVMQECADKHPTYRKMMNRMFCEWLRKKYGSAENLTKAWGQEAFHDNESLADDTIYFYSNRTLFGKEGMKQNAYRRKRMLDSARFAYETQNDFYSRFIKEIRATGYKGLIIGSPWMAGDGMPHYYNVHSDVLCGIVDRHAYWGGGDEGHTLELGKIRHRTMLAKPGSGLLSMNASRVKDVPFVTSEWMSTEPNQWLCEAPILIALYGMGLQGWNGSFSYSIDHLHNIYNANYPAHIGSYPLLARMIYRNEIKRGDIIASNCIDIECFQEHGYENEDFPEHLVAGGGVEINFGKGKTFKNEVGVSAKKIRSNTGQLLWNYSDNPFVQTQTDYTEGFVGFATDQEMDFAHTRFTTTNRFCALFISSADDVHLKDSKNLFITALARHKHLGMEYSTDEKELVSIGEKGTIIAEGVHAKVEIKRNGKCKAYALDVNGKDCAEIPTEVNGDTVTFTISPEYKSFWYRVCFS